MGYYNLISLMSPKGPSFDPDAQLFITNAAITEPVQQNAINNLVIDLKGYGIWTKMKALYPFVGGTAAQHKFNLRSPLDTDAAFRLVFNGGWTHSSTGALPNGTNAYADTLLTPSLTQTVNSNSIGAYSGNISNATGGVIMGAFNSGGGKSLIFSNTTQLSTRLNDNLVSSAISGDIGLLMASRTDATTTKLYKNSTLLANGNSGGVLPDYKIFLANMSFNGINPYTEWSINQLRLAFVGDGFDTTEQANLYTAVQTFQTTLNRQVGVPIVSDSDAQAFLNAAVITDTTQASAVNTLVTDLKGYGIWTKMNAIYPFVGGTASQHKFNLRNPLDTDAAFRLVFNGGWVHSNTGSTPNGVNAWANTYFKSGINFTSKDNAHYSFYSRTDLASAGIEIGADESPSNHALYTKSTSNTAIFLLNAGTYPNVAVANSLGFYQGNRNAVNTINAWKNGSKLNEMASTSVVSTATFMAISAYNNAINTPQYYSAKEVAFSSFGDGLTDTEAANYYTAVQTFQTTLSRNV